MRRHSAQASFTLFETVIALGLLTYLTLHVAGVQGNAIYFSEYGRSVLKATWLAKRLMSQVEYHASSRPFDELKAEVKEEPFPDEKEFSYSLTIRDWKLPIVEFLTGGGADAAAAAASGEDPGDAGRASAGGGALGSFKDMAEQVLGKELLKIARVEVFWSEGARQNSTALTYLLTNHSKVGEILETLRDVAAPVPSPTPSPTATGTPPPPPPRP